MRKIYNYRNCVITVITPSTSSEKLRKATETFLRKVAKEKQHGNCNTTRSIKEK